MTLTRLQLYFFGLLLLLLPMIVYRIVWLQRSVVTTAVVTDIYTTWRYKNTYPRIQFEAGDKNIIFSGHYNMPYEPGDSLEVRYIPGNPTNCKVNTFWNCWIEVVLIDGFLLIFWSFLFFKKIIPGAAFSITRNGIKSSK